jgi:hypothetical protein
MLLRAGRFDAWDGDGPVGGRDEPVVSAGGLARARMG